MSFKRMAGYAGITYVILMVVAFILQGSPPGPDALAPELADYVADTGSALSAALALSAIGTVALVLFLAGFVVPFLSSDREHGEGYGVAIIAGLTIVFASVSVAYAAFGALALRLDELDGPTVRALWDAGYIAYGIGIIGSIAPLGAAAAAIMKRGVMVRWFGTFSAVVAVLCLSGVFPIVSAGSLSQLLLLGYLATTVWTLTASILMVREPAAANAGRG